MKLDRCQGCGGFVPTAADVCPHCRGSRVKLGAVATLALSTAVSFTLMACYGGPPPPPDSPNPTGTGTPSAPVAVPDAGK